MKISLDRTLAVKDLKLTWTLILNQIFHCMMRVVLVVWWFHWDCILGCNWHIQLSLTYSAFCARNTIKYFGSTSMLTSFFWNCIFPWLNWMSRMWRLKSSIDSVYAILLWLDVFSSYKWPTFALVWWQGFLGNKSPGSNLPDSFIQPQPNYCSHLKDCRRELRSEWAASHVESGTWIHEHAFCRTNMKLFQRAM